MMKRSMIWAVVFLIAGTAGWGLLRKPAKSNADIWFIPKTIDRKIEYWQVVQEGVAAASQEFGKNFVTLGTETEADVQGQIRILEKAIEARPLAVILAATDYEQVVPTAERVRKAGIPLITMDSGLKDGVSASLIATDNYAAGAKVGEAMERILPDKGEVAIISFIQGAAPAIERENGLRSQLAASGGYTVIGTYYCDGLSDRAYELTRKLLQEHPELKGIAALNEPSTLGMVRAVEDAGFGGRIKLVGFDNAKDEIEKLEDGTLQAVIVQKPFNMGYLAARAAIQLAEGRSLEKRIDTGSEVIWKDTMYDKENQKLLFPFMNAATPDVHGAAATAMPSR